MQPATPDGLTHPQHELARILELVECVTLEVGEAHGTEILDPFPTPSVLPNPRHRLLLFAAQNTTTNLTLMKSH